ncbi:MAG: acetoin utilization protein AcuC [Corynebacterium camporealensis]|uniref:acetoin utilization protein AcuC n=1 Tax=Corynebacterium camporealensis TaxID=161896 RepID=UPI002A91B1E6|nr:acetoin utilization protein AcuC [Corynebacterium camporealensis]MDY5839350.1 acetoin utilization protein AcuC [Corynebacterium camporealensis]
MNTPLLFSSTEMRRYSLGDTHPMGPGRFQHAMGLADYFGLLSEFDVVKPRPARTSELTLVHTPDYVDATRAEVPSARYGIGTEDNPVAHGLSTAAAYIAGATLQAAQAVWTGDTNVAVNLAGGLHHSFRDSMTGFCMYNDAAVAIQWMLDNGAERVAYLDLDAHHGDGVESIFWDDPRVLTISIHESGLYLFPGTGFAHEIGGERAQGTAVNLALPRNTTDTEWLQAIHALIPPLLRQFKPQVLVSQHGSDPHKADPLADLDLSLDAMALAYRSVAAWAKKLAEDRWIALGGGGYRMDSVARAWVQVIAAAAGVELPANSTMPSGWEGSKTIGDEGVDLDVLNEFGPQNIITSCPHAALTQTTKAVFPYWGLRPYG